jgi:hypothetical protein
MAKLEGCNGRGARARGKQPPTIGRTAKRNFAILGCDYDNYNSHDKHSAPRSPLWSLGGYEISLFESWFAPLGIRGAEMIDYWCQGFRNFSCAERVSLRREARMTGPYAQVGVANVLGVRVDACAVWY